MDGAPVGAVATLGALGRAAAVEAAVVVLNVEDALEAMGLYYRHTNHGHRSAKAAPPNELRDAGTCWTRPARGRARG